MFNLLKKAYYKIESLRGKALYVSILIIFILFTVIGLIIGYFTNSELKQDEADAPVRTVTSVEFNSQTYEGKVQYINPLYFPEDEISYVLIDSSGKEIILLKANDQKLPIAEGLNVTVVGNKSKTKDNSREVLNVKDIIIKNATD